MGKEEMEKIFGNLHEEASTNYSRVKFRPIGPISQDDMLRGLKSCSILSFTDLEKGITFQEQNNELLTEHVIEIIYENKS